MTSVLNRVRARSDRAAMAFPVAVWGIWRLVHAVVLLAFGGDLADDTLRFDGAWLSTILDHGYLVSDPSFRTQQNPAFFPGVPWLTEPLSWLIGDRSAALVIANVFGVAAFVAVFGALRAVFDDKVAIRGTIALALWPSSLVLWAYYTEGLFVVATAAAVWADKRSKPMAAVAGLVLAGVTRVVGLAVGPVLAVVRVVRLRRIDATSVAYAVSGAVAFAIVGGAQERQTGDALAFVRAQKGWDREFSPPWVPIRTAIDDIVEKLPTPALELGLNLAAIAVIGVALLVATCHWRRRPDAWGALALGWTAYLLPLCSKVVSSQVRFALGAWPAVAVLGTSESVWAQRLRWVAALAGAALSVVLLRRWASGGFIG